MQSKPIELASYITSGQRRRKRIKALRMVIYAVLAFVVATLVMAALVPAVLDAMERESQWRQERLCRIYDICDPKAGP